MGPIDLQVHSCEHCRHLIVDVDERRRPQGGGGHDAGDMSRKKALSDFTLRDIRNADADRCKFCSWFLDEVAISRDAVLQHVLMDLTSDDPFSGVMLAMQDQTFAMRTSCAFQIYSDPGDPVSQFITTRPVESSTASTAGFERLSSWLETCRASHQKCGEMAASARRSDMAPARLIRIVDLARGSHFLRLRSTPGLEALPEFVALSYCWGGDQALKCLKSTIAASRACSTNDGFLGTRSVDASTLAFTLRYRCEDDNLGAVTLVQLEIAPEPINFRGWTFQERLLSPRTIEYGTRQTRWICQQSKYKPGFTDGWRRNAEYFSLRRDTLILPSLRDTTESGRSRFGERFAGTGIELSRRSRDVS